MAHVIFEHDDGVIDQKADRNMRPVRPVLLQAKRDKQDDEDDDADAPPPEDGDAPVALATDDE